MAVADVMARPRLALPWRRVGVAIGLACCAALALLCRLPFLNVPLTQDEGGYAYVARLWAHGARLYDTAWVDRPQGLALLFRLMVSVAPGTAEMRLFGAVYAIACTLVLAYLIWRLYGSAAALCGAALYAVFSSGPQIEGFTVNGELLATLPAVAAVAALVTARRSARPAIWLFLAGCCAAGALLVKQSAIDAALVVLLLAPLGTESADDRGRRRGVSANAMAQDGVRAARAGWRARVRRLALVSAGLGGVLALSVLHGALTGWQRYLNAVLLDNLHYRGAEAAADTAANALAGLQWFWAGDAFLIVAAALGLLIVPRARGVAAWLPLPWLAAAALGVSLGGLYNRHYFIQLLPPLCLLAAAGLVGVARQVRRVPLTGLALLPPLAALGLTVQVNAPYYLDNARAQVTRHIYTWPEYLDQDDLVAFLRARVPAGQPFYATYAAPELHYLADRPSVTRYLWRRPLGELPGAYEAVLRAVDDDEPVCVVAVQAVSRPPGDLRMRAAIGRHYEEAWSRPGLAAFCRPTH